MRDDASSSLAKNENVARAHNPQCPSALFALTVLPLAEDLEQARELVPSPPPEDPIPKPERGGGFRHRVPPPVQHQSVVRVVLRVGVDPLGPVVHAQVVAQLPTDLRRPDGDERESDAVRQELPPSLGVLEDLLLAERSAERSRQHDEGRPAAVVAEEVGHGHGGPVLVEASDRRSGQGRAGIDPTGLPGGGAGYLRRRRSRRRGGGGGGEGGERSRRRPGRRGGGAAAAGGAEARAGRRRGRERGGRAEEERGQAAGEGEHPLGAAAHRDDPAGRVNGGVCGCARR